MKIVISGAGYVGLSNGILLAQHNEVVFLDILQDKVDKLNRKQSPIEDAEIEDYLKNKKLNSRSLFAVFPFSLCFLFCSGVTNLGIYFQLQI